MPGGRSLKEIISLTKRTARNIRQSLDDLAQELINNQRQLQQQPQLARVPVHNRSNSKHPFASRSFGTSSVRQQSVRYASTFIRPNYVIRNNVRQQTFKNIWSFSSFKQLNTIGGRTISRGIFPSTLYSNFVKTNSRSYSQYTNFTHQCVQNLNQSIRAMCLQTKDELIKGNRAGYSYNHNVAYAREVYNMARTNSSFSDNFENDYSNDNCFVEFQLNSIKFSIPTMTFVDDDILHDLELDLCQHQSHLNEVYKQVELIKDQFGSLPLSLEKNGSVLRIHFTNCDAAKVEMLLRDIGVTKGVIHEHPSRAEEMIQSSSSSSSSSSSLSSQHHSYNDTDSTPILSTTDEEDQLSSYYMDRSLVDEDDDDDEYGEFNYSEILTDEFFPVVEMNPSVYIVDEQSLVNSIMV